MDRAPKTEANANKRKAMGQWRMVKTEAHLKDEVAGFSREVIESVALASK